MSPLIDPFGRTVTYLRVSVTDRCDFRCYYCMAEDISFVPRDDLLSLEELGRVCSAFVARGVRKIRLTGGEPLVRRNIMVLVRALSRHLESGALDELTLTTNASQLRRYADELATCGVKRINISLDTLDPGRFQAITRQDRLAQVLDGIAAAKAAGLKIKINKVALGPYETGEFETMVRWCAKEGFGLTFIEAMPFGETGGGRADEFLPLSEVRDRLGEIWTLTPLDETTGGPARYTLVEETGQKLGFITPLSAHFCDSCNRVRLTCTGILYMCLGQNDAADLRTPLRVAADDGPLMEAIDKAIAAKPSGHGFAPGPGNDRSVIGRHMNLTGG